MIDLALALIRAIHIAALAVIGGGLVFRVWVARPLIARAGAPDAARFLRWQVCALVAALAVAIVSGAAWLVVEAVNMSGEPLSALFGSDVLGTVLTRTQFGAVWQWRAAAVPPLVAYAWLRWREPEALPALDGAATALAGAWIVALGWAGHAAAMGGAAGAVHLAGHAVHLLAAAAWLGGLPALAVLLIAAERARTKEARALAAMLTRRFSVLGLVCVTALIATGILNAWFMIDRLDAFVTTTYGRLLVLKIVLFAAMLVLAARNRWQLAPRVVTAPASIRELARNALLELSLGIVVLLVVGLLAVTPPAHAPESHAAQRSCEIASVPSRLTCRASKHDSVRVKAAERG